MIKITKNAIILLVVSLFTVTSWIGFELYRIWKAPASIKVTEEELETFEPKLDNEAFTTLREVGNP
ncbi:MAG: hypothetical protein ACOC6Q_00195 [Patescibacteria group bacterium]